jgi:hypothetical protein
MKRFYFVLCPLLLTFNTFAKETYVAVLQPLNQHSTDFISGAVTLDIDGDLIAANVRYYGSEGPIIHAQSIHEGALCPTESADENLDGYIDTWESVPFTSKVLIPLDGDLNTQKNEKGMYPISDNWGSYAYSKTGSLKALMKDLYLKDDDTNDDIAKLPRNYPLMLQDRVVMIYGTVDQETLPIACGTFKKVTHLPGVYERDDISLSNLGSRSSIRTVKPSRIARNITPRPSPRRCNGFKTCR